MAIICEEFTLDKLNGIYFKDGGAIHIGNLSPEKWYYGGVHESHTVHFYPIDEIKQSFIEYCRGYIRTASTCGTNNPLDGHQMGVTFLEQDGDAFNNFYNTCVTDVHLKYTILDFVPPVDSNKDNVIDLRCELVVTMINPSLVYNTIKGPDVLEIPKIIEGKVNLFNLLKDEEKEQFYKLFSGFVDCHFMAFSVFLHEMGDKMKK